jgi:iron(III) transport system substrate-binding protein
MHGTKQRGAKEEGMRSATFSRRSILKASTTFAAPLFFPKLLNAALPDPSEVSPALIEAARKEDVVAFYTAMEIPVAETLAKAFEAKYPGVSVLVRRSGAERVFQRIGKEEELSLYQVDVVCSTDASHFISWKRDHLLAPYIPADVARHFPPEQIDLDGMYASAFAVLSPIGYNTNLVNGGDVPKSFTDLLDPKWKGRIVKGRPDYSGTILTATFQLARELGWSYFEKLAEQNVLQVRSALDPPRRLAMGERAIQADGLLSNLLLLKEQGAPVEPVYPTEGTPLITAPSAIFQSAAHPNAARLFQSFLFSLDAQQLLVDTSGLCSFHALVKDRLTRASLRELKLMKTDPAVVEAQREEIKIRYNKIFGN